MEVNDLSRPKVGLLTNQIENIAVIVCTIYYTFLMYFGGFLIPANL